MKNLLDLLIKFDPWKKLFSLIAIIASVFFSIGVYLENWYRIGSNTKMPLIKTIENAPDYYIQKFSLGNGFAAFPMLEGITENEVKLQFYYYTTRPGRVFILYNTGHGEQSTDQIDINAGAQIIKNTTFTRLICATTYAFRPGFINEYSTLYGNEFFLETGPCLTGKNK